MSKIDYQALREKAEKATCGVWSLEYGEGRFDGDDALIHREVAGYIPICRIDVPYNGYEIKTITHPHFGDKPVKVFAIKVNIDG